MQTFWKAHSFKLSEYVVQDKNKPLKYIAISSLSEFVKFTETTKKHKEKLNSFW